MLNRFIYGIDQLSKSVGHAFTWCVVILTVGTCYEVFMRYVVNDPTAWAFDMSYLMYGAVFFMAGAYTLSRGGHVRADMFYRLLPPRVQASIDLALYCLFFSRAFWHWSTPAGVMATSRRRFWRSASIVQRACLSGRSK